jgi:ABC-type histidine transport system ATPase subunit
MLAPGDTMEAPRRMVILDHVIAEDAAPQAMFESPRDQRVRRFVAGGVGG